VPLGIEAIHELVIVGEYDAKACDLASKPPSGGTRKKMESIRLMVE
jgi:hypothetical protein